MAGTTVTAAAVGAGAVAATAEAAPGAAPEASAVPKGYHETDHIREYYRRARSI